MELRLDNKVALITGGSRGIGKATATAFAKAGAKVMIVARKQDVLESAANEINAESATSNCHWFVGNAGDPDSAAAGVAATVEHFGGLDILVNNAATNPYAGPMIDIDLARWDKTIQVNLTGPLLWSQAAWKATMSESGGVIINISSVGAKLTSPSIGVYDMTKAALLHVTEQLAAELAPGVRVNAICPGLVKTDMARFLWEGEGGDKIANTYPLKRLGEVADIANAALYLASDASSWTTGQHLVLDGGGLVSFSA